MKDFDPDIHIFYHLFVMKGWKPLFQYHLTKVYESGLYDKCQTFHLGIIFKDKKYRKEFQGFLKDHPKIKVYYHRLFKEVPVQIWKNPLKKIPGQLGEGESILKMVEFAQSNKGNDVYLFFHSKGITVTNDKKRSQIKHFYQKGLKTSCTPQEASTFIKHHMTKEVVTQWENKVKNLEDKNFYYYVWNFFWSKGSFLRKFDFNRYNSESRFAKRYKTHDRHWSACFPINLNMVINKIQWQYNGGRHIRRLINIYQSDGPLPKAQRAAILTVKTKAKMISKINTMKDLTAFSKGDNRSPIKAAVKRQKKKIQDYKDANRS